MPNNFAPKTNLDNMGMDALGGDDIVFKRKFRWTLQLKTNCNNGNIPPYFVKVASRPNLTIDETEINFLNSKMWIPGKASWETITVTLYDLAGSGASQGNASLYSWLATNYDFVNATYKQSSKKGAVGGGAGGGYACTAYLDLFDGCGKNIESWQLDNAWPQAVNFGELDYSSSDEVNIELTLRYSEVKYISHCPSGQINPCCAGC
jgi:hypothetical protein